MSANFVRLSREQLDVVFPEHLVAEKPDRLETSAFVWDLILLDIALICSCAEGRW